MALTVAQLTARLTADTSNFYKSMSIADAAFLRTGSIASRVGAGVGIAVAAIGLMSLKAAGDFEQSMNILGAVSGATTGQMKKMQTQAIALGQDMKLPNVSAKDAADAMTELSKAGLSVKDIMGATRGVLQLGISANIDFATSATITARALNAFHLNGREAVRVADLLTATANKTTADVNDLALGVQMASAQFHAGRQPIQNLTTALGLMANAGIAGSDAGTSLKTMMNRLMAPTDKASAEMKKLGINVYDTHGRMKEMPAIIQTFTQGLKGQSEAARNAALYTIFGSDAIRAARVLLAAGTEGWNSLQQATTRGGEAQAFAEARTKGFNGAVQGVISQVETLAVQLGQALLPAATSAAQGLANFLSKIDVGKITAFFGFLADGVRILYAFATANGQATPMLVGIGVALAALNFVILPVINGVRTLTAAVIAFTESLAINPVTAWAVAIGAIAGILYSFITSSNNAADSQRNLQSAVQASTDAFRKFQDAIGSVNEADIRYKTALLNRAAAHKQLHDLELQGITDGDAYRRASLAVRSANEEVRSSSIARSRAIADGAQITMSAYHKDAEAIRIATAKRDADARALALYPQSIELQKRLVSSQDDLNKALSTGVTHSKNFATEFVKTANSLSGQAKANFIKNNKWVISFDKYTSLQKLSEVITSITGKAPTLKQMSQIVGTGVADGIAAGITSAPAVQAAVRAVKDAIAAAKAAGKIKSPSQVTQEEIGKPFAHGIARGIAVGATDISTQMIRSVTAPIAIVGEYAKGAAKNIAHKYTDTQLRAFVTGSHSLPEKMGESLKRMINTQKGILDRAKPVFEKWFGRLQDRALRAFDAVTQTAKMPSDLLLAGKTPSELSLGKKTASEAALAAEQAVRDNAELKKRQDEAQAIIDNSASAKAAIVQKEGESDADFRTRQAEEIKKIDQDVADATQAIADVAWEKRRATLESDGASERAILEGKAADERSTLEAAAAQERLDWESQRENQRVALEDRLTKLQENLLAGKLKIKTANAEITQILKDAGVDYSASGNILGREFAAGLLASKAQILKQARAIAAAVRRILQLNSPAKEGPLSNLDTWWEAFAPTLLSGLDTRELGRTVSGAVAPPTISPVTSGPSSGPGPTINLTVTDQTFAGMSREQADSVAREVQAAIARQVRSTV